MKWIYLLLVAMSWPAQAAKIRCHTAADSAALAAHRLKFDPVKTGEPEIATSARRLYSGNFGEREIQMYQVIVSDADQNEQWLVLFSIFRGETCRLLNATHSGREMP